MKCIRYRKRRKTQVWHYFPWNWDIEPGDLLVDAWGGLMRAVESCGNNQSRSGTLNTRAIKPPLPGMIAEIRDGEVWWVERIHAPPESER